MENYPDLLDAVTFEDSITSYLSNKIKGDIVKMVLSKLDSRNHFYSMIASKAKGKDLNLSQIIGCTRLFLQAGENALNYILLKILFLLWTPQK